MPGDQALILDWRWSCDGVAPPAQTIATVCLACNVAISIRVLSPGDAGAVTQSIVAAARPALPPLAAPPSPAAAMPSLPLIVVPPVPPIMVSAAPAGAVPEAGGGGAAAQPPASGAAFGGAQDPSALVVETVLQAALEWALDDDQPRSGAPESFGAAAIPAVAAARFERAPAPIAQVPLSLAQTPLQTAAVREAQRAEPRVAGGDPPPASQPRAPQPGRTPHPSHLPPFAPFGATGAAAAGGSSHSGGSGAIGAAGVLAALVAALADLSRRLVPRRVRIPTSRLFGRIERPG